MKWIVAIVALCAIACAVMGALCSRDDNADGRQATAMFASAALVCCGIDAVLLLCWGAVRMFTS